MTSTEGEYATSVFLYPPRLSFPARRGNRNCLSEAACFVSGILMRNSYTVGSFRLILKITLSRMGKIYAGLDALVERARLSRARPRGMRRNLASLIPGSGAPN
jgi:hypothetical protein